MNEFDSLINETNPIEKEEIYTESFRAGKRTYFFDVKKMKSSEYYITITESKKRLLRNGQFVYEKHHLYLYKEDFDKFITAINNTVDFVKGTQPELSSSLLFNDDKNQENLTPILNFEDLDK